MQNQQEFFIKYNNKFLDVDGVFGNQCVDVIKAYVKEVLGIIPVISGNAIDFWNYPPAGFTLIKNTPFNKPLPGDIIIWNTKYSNPYGHIAVVNWSRYFDVGVFEQNNPVGSPCHFGTHNYKNVLGWLRPQPVSNSNKFVMDYACFNMDANLMEQGRQLVLKYTDGKVDAKFAYYNAPCRIDGVIRDEQVVQFLETYAVNQPFVFIKYVSLNTPNYDWTKTPYYPQVDKMVTTTEGQDLSPLYVAYEMANAMVGYCQNHGIAMDSIDIFTPDEAFVVKKWTSILAVLPRLIY